VINIIAGAFLIFGIFFFLVGSIGVLRFPDALTRAHGAAKCDTLGAVLCLIALVILKGFTPSSLKLILIIIFIWISNPTSTHMIAKAILNKNSLEG